MATGDITSVVVRSDGWSLDVTIEGFTTGASYDYGTPPGSAKFTCTVTSEGYDATGSLGTTSRTIYGTKTVRKPYPDEADLDETVSGSDIVVRVALSECIYNDDTLDRVQISAAWATNDGGSSETSNAYDTTTTFTNNSTQDYPVAFGQWDGVAGVLTKERVKDDFVMAFNAFHGHGIACVKFTATGVTSSHAETATVTSQTATQRSATSLYMSAYQATIDLSGFTQGETITLRAQVYPNVGDAASVQDTTGRTTAANECLGWNEPTIICDKSDALDVIRYVHSSSGNDTTGDGSSGNPWATIAKAYLTATVNVVKLQDAGPHNLGTTGTRRTTDEWVTVEPDSGITPTVLFTTTLTYRCERLCFRNVTVTPASTSSYLNGESLNFLWFDGCTFDKNGVGNLSVGPGYLSLCSYFTNCDGDLAHTTWRLYAFSTSLNVFHFDGCTFAASTTPCAQWYRVVACTVDGTVEWAQKAAAASGPIQNGAIFANNVLLNNTSTSLRTLVLGETEALSNIAIVGNIFEKTGTTSQCVKLFADGVVVTATNFVIAHNTSASGGSSGDRWNLFYNDAGSSAYDHTLIFFLSNFLSEAYIKSDTFPTANANRVGNWDQLYGVNFNQNTFDNTAAFPWEFGGIGYTETTPSFEDESGDDYTPAAADTVLRATASGLFHLRYDLYGHERKTTTYDRGAINDSFVATVATATPASVTSTTASLGGEVTDDGGATVTERGVCYNTTGTPTTSDTKNTNGTGTGAFSETITGLTPGETYYVRAYAINSVGTAYGSEVEFSTDEDSVAVSNPIPPISMFRYRRL